LKEFNILQEYNFPRG